MTNDSNQESYSQIIKLIFEDAQESIAVRNDS